MVFLALSLLGRAVNTVSVERAATKAPKTYAPTPREYRQVASWVLHYTNRARQKHKLASLQRYLALESAAQKHSNWMARTRRFSHQGRQGSKPHQRMVAETFGGSTTGENIYQFPVRRDHKKLAENLVDGWMKSPGHRKNILNPGFKYLGVGIARSGDYIYATQNFGG